MLSTCCSIRSRLKAFLKELHTARIQIASLVCWTSFQLLACPSLISSKYVYVHIDESKEFLCHCAKDSIYLSRYYPFFPACASSAVAANVPDADIRPSAITLRPIHGQDTTRTPRGYGDAYKMTSFLPLSMDMGPAVA